MRVISCIAGRWIVFGSICLLLCFPGCSKPPIFQIETDPLPAWFWDMPQVDGVSTAIGYSSAYYNAGRDTCGKFGQAFHDGAWRLYSDRSSRVYRNCMMVITPYGLMKAEDTLSIDVDSSG
ncbi:MAG: hypothetical protein P9M15_06900, partial [Candidatus Electryoneaceae bacterium]|nr:hypothetical protein [Candidatus Electryoneaceae bacterium]